MGLRTASLRRPLSDVMAPALTDAAQARNFSLPPAAGVLEPINKNKSHINNLDCINLCPKASSTYLNLQGASEKRVLFPQTMSFKEEQDKMGLQKAGINVNNLKSVSSDEEQLSVDDLMRQVFKTIGDTDQLNTSSTDLELDIDKDLLDQVDTMMISMDDQPDALETAQKIKEEQVEMITKDESLKSASIFRKLDFLKRRVYRLQSRLMSNHVSNEVVGVFENVHRSLKKSKEPDLSADPTQLKPLTTPSTNLLNKKLEMAKALQANAVARQKMVPKYFGSGSIETSYFRNSANCQMNIPQWSDDHKSELRKISVQLKSQLHFVQKQVDSEDTETSSSGESCDESYNNPHQQYLSIQKRARYKYASDRAALASRWIWLQYQISDLEYRVRQHTDLQKQIRTAKGSIKLGEPVIRPQPVQSQSEIAGHHDYGISPADGALNGYLGQLPGASGGKDEEGYSARTRPLVGFRKRKAYLMRDLHAISKKANRPSTIRCTCTSLDHSCAICTGRTDPTEPRDPPETLGKFEKIGLLDPGFHPVLSMDNDIGETLHFEAIMKMPEWQQRSMKMKTIKVLHKPDKMDCSIFKDRMDGRPSYEHRTKKLEHRKKYNRLRSSTVAALSEKIKTKMKRKVGRPAKYPRRLPINANPDTSGTEDAEVEATLGGQLAQHKSMSVDSPGGSPLMQMQSISGYKQNNRNIRSDSYDIDNIVIPYSVAASTRVEKLPYKEILTPKWRIADGDYIKVEPKNNGSVTDFNEENESEDLSEEATQARHDRSEYDEKKRFLSYLKYPPGYGRPRSHRRNDSLAESSGANTPDPASPRPPEGAKFDGLSSPPPTPIGVVGVDEALPSIALLRRRTVSQSSQRIREVKEDGMPQVDYVEVAPYETRTFPLLDKEYDQMVQETPDGMKTNYRAQDTGFIRELEEKDIHDSGDSESTESALEDTMIDDDDDQLLLMEEEDDEDEEDPNDPEWTDIEKSSHRDRHHRR